LELGIVAEVIGTSVPSGVRPQPEGAEEILTGAENRAFNARKQFVTLPFGARIIFIGIENGIVHKKSSRYGIASDYAEVVLLDDESVFFANSAGHPVNYGDVEEAQTRGFDQCTVAEVTRERTGCDATDATPHYTGGRMTRAELLKQAVKLALAQWQAGGGK
jgi:non-canonical (house-cleaning) NTP pyrophosphatase